MCTRFSQAFTGALAFICAAVVPLDAHGTPVDGKTEFGMHDWIPATDTTRVTQYGQWRPAAYRYAESEHLLTFEDAAALECVFRGTGLVVRLAPPIVPSYGEPDAGKLVVTIDDADPQALYPRAEAREIVVARGLADTEHVVRVVHRFYGGPTECRIEGLRVLRRASGDLAFSLHGEENAYLVDVRATLVRAGQTVRRTLVRNWLTGQCRLAGLPPGDGYVLELEACGWETTRVDDIRIVADRETALPPVYLSRAPAAAATGSRFSWPAIGRPAIRRPSETFRARCAGYGAEIRQVRLVRQVGPARISRTLTFEEDTAAAFYYDRELVATLPGDMPPGLYDLEVELSGRRLVRRSARSVHVVADYPADPVFMTFGHLDTWGQYQAEYLRRVAEVANVLAPDMVLVANAVNPAYLSGALAALEMPYTVTFGNHQFHGHEKWFGEPVRMIDVGPDLCILNFGLPWHADVSKADALMASRSEARVTVINAFEHNAPVEGFLDRHRVRLIHDGHGPGKKVMEIGATPTVRVGKVDSESFRVVRFRNGRVASCTYRGDEVAPIPFPRRGESPVRVAYRPGNDGTHPTVRATVTNDLAEAFPDGRVTFVLPRGAYRVEGARLESAVPSDDGAYTVLAARVDLPPTGSVTLTVRPE